MSIVYNYFWDTVDPAHPFIEKSVCNALALVPDDATREATPEYEKGTIPCWSGEKWIIRHDWRQETLYSLETAELTTYPTVDIDEAYYTAHFTDQVPPYQFNRWDGTTWQEDTEKATAYAISEKAKEKTQRIKMAVEQIDALTDAVDYLTAAGQETDRFSTLLAQWKRYRGQLVATAIKTGNEVFPDAPATWESLNG